ncbi:hypothetical protein AgCh_039550 [Apium graveolens]
MVDGSSALIINESQTFDDEPRSQTPVVSPSEQRTNDSQEQVILELEEDGFYTLDELDELDQSMAYLARKFSNIRVKKPRYFKGKGQSFNKDSSWKGKEKYNSNSKNGYKTGSVDRSKIRCFNYDELGHFSTECRKPKKAKKDKVYLELEAKYEALLKKQQSKVYIAEGKSWDDSENDEDEEVGNYALMALEQRESSSSKSQVPTLTTIDLNVSQYKETVEKMSTEMFHIQAWLLLMKEATPPPRAKHLGYIVKRLDMDGRVSFSTMEEAERAIAAMNDREILQHHIKMLLVEELDHGHKDEKPKVDEAESSYSS